MTRTSCPRSIHGRSAPDPGLYCAQRLLHSSIALNGRRGSPPFQGFGVVEPQLGRWRPSLVHRSPAHNLSCRNSTYTLYVSAVPRSEKHRQWPSPVRFRALKKRRSTRLNRPAPCTPRGAQGADLAAPLVGNGENGRRRRSGQFRGQTMHTSYSRVVVLLVGVSISILYSSSTTSYYAYAYYF